MYKTTQKAHDHLARVGSSATTPSTSGRSDAGLDPAVFADTTSPIEYERLSLLTEKADIDKRLGKLRVMIALAKTESRAGKYNPLFRKWEEEAGDLGHKSQAIQARLGALNAAKKAQQSEVIGQCFIDAARRMLAPEAFDFIMREAHERSKRGQAMNLGLSAALRAVAQSDA